MYNLFGKRLIDIIIAILAMLFLLPLLLLVSFILLFTGEHEVLYLQQRIGFKNRKFRIWKYATMIKNSPNIGTGSLTLRNDSRVLPVGRFLRKTKINELPQIINVLIGNMSIVGPRPQMEVDFLKFSDKVQRVIYDTPPGITGIGSLVFRDEEKWISEASGDKNEFYKDFIAPYKGELELWYLKHISVLTDLKIIFLTIWVIIVPDSNLIYRLFKDLPPKPIHLL